MYEYSPEVSDFFVELSEQISDKMVLPNTVKREFDKNHNECRGRQRKKFRNVPYHLKNQLSEMKDGINKQFSIMKRFKMPNIDTLESIYKVKVEEIENAFDLYAVDHDEFSKINDKYLEQDKIQCLINSLIEKGNLLDGFNLDELYLICEEGESRYMKKTPPGFEDAKDKTGIVMFHDLIIWNEILRYCKSNKKNLIFVTDDVKKDWWELDNGEVKEFRKELVSEFKHDTQKEISTYVSHEFFKDLADYFHMEIPNSIEWALGYDTQRYVNGIKNKLLLLNLLVSSGETFIDTTTLTDYDSSYFEISDEEYSWNLVRYEYDGYYENEAVYYLVYNIKATAYSSSYCGRDSATNEILLSNRRTHIIKGDMKVKVTREVGTLLNDYVVSNIKIASGKLVEIDTYMPADLCTVCGEKLGMYYGYDDELYCSECYHEIDGSGCEMCGRIVPDDCIDRETNYCYKCIEKYGLKNKL